MELAVQKNLDVEKLEKLMELQERWTAQQAKRQFDEAMAEFQAECPTIKKTKAGGKTKAGQIAYFYAPLESIVEQVKEILHKHGFSYTIKTETKQAGVKVTCVVKHTAGHSEASEMEVPLGTKTDIMSAPQVVAAATTFAKRYAFCNAFGILTGEDDIDGQIEKIQNPSPTSRKEPPKATPVRKKVPAGKKFIANGKEVSREEFVKVIVEAARKHDINIDEIVNEVAGCDFPDMTDNQILAVASVIRNRIADKRKVEI